MALAQLVKSPQVILADLLHYSQSRLTPRSGPDKQVRGKAEMK